MKKSESDLLDVVLRSTSRGVSHRITDEERKDAKELVKKELCFWSIDHDHIMSYDIIRT